MDIFSNYFFIKKENEESEQGMLFLGVCF